MKKFIAIAALTAALAAPTAQARETTSFAEMDRNTNGTLSLAEVRAVKPDTKPETFAMADSDANGELTLAEYEAWRASRAVDPTPVQPKADQ